MFTIVIADNDCFGLAAWREEEQNREEGEMAQKKLGGGRKRNVTV